MKSKSTHKASLLNAWGQSAEGVALLSVLVIASLLLVSVLALRNMAAVELLKERSKRASLGTLFMSEETLASALREIDSAPVFSTQTAVGRPFQFTPLTASLFALQTEVERDEVKKTRGYLLSLRKGETAPFSFTHLLPTLPTAPCLATERAAFQPGPSRARSVVRCSVIHPPFHGFLAANLEPAAGLAWQNSALQVLFVAGESTIDRLTVTGLAVLISTGDIIITSVELAAGSALLLHSTTGRVVLKRAVLPPCESALFRAEGRAGVFLGEEPPGPQGVGATFGCEFSPLTPFRNKVLVAGELE